MKNLRAQCSEFYITGTAASSACKEAVEDVVWIGASSSLRNTISGNSLTKASSNNNWDGNGFSYQSVSNNGYMQSTVVEVNRERVFGLSSTDASSSYTSIQYAFHLLNTGSLQIYESGVSRGLFGTYAASDVLKIAVENNIVKYYQNGTQIYISAVTPTLPLYVDVCTRAVGATVWDVKVSNGNTGTFNATGTNAGTSPSYQWQLNGSNVGTNSSTYTNTSLVAGDVLTCTQTSDVDGCSPSTLYNSNQILIGDQNPTIQNAFYITGTAAASACKEVLEDVVWIIASSSAKNQISGNSLAKITSNGNWDGNAFSYQSVSNNGYMQCVATETNKDRLIGLSSTDASSANSTIQFGFRMGATGNLNIYESGVNRGTFATYTTGDILKIAVESNVVKYYLNGAMIHISAVAPTLPLYVDVSLRSVGATVSTVQVSNGNTGAFTAVATNMGPSPTYQWTINGSNTGTNSPTYTNTSLPNSDVVNCIITPDLGGCSSGYVSNNAAVGDINQTLQNEFYITGTPASSACKESLEDVVWSITASAGKNSILDNTLTKIASNSVWDGNGFSLQSVANNGYMQTIAEETNEARMIGLSNTDGGPGYNTIQYAFYLTNTGALQIYETGTSRGAFGTYTTGDTLKIAIENNVVKYYKNSTAVYISNIAPTLPLYVDVSTNSIGATVSDVRISNGNISTFTASGTNLGPAPVYQWQLNGVNVGTNSTTYTNTGLNNNDVITCLVTPDLGGCSSSLFSSNSITIRDINQTQQNAFYITGSPVSTACREALVNVVWVIASSGVKNTINANTLTKRTSNGNWDGNGFSYQSVANNGYMQTTVAETNKSRMIGLSATDVNSNFTSIQFAFYLINNGSLRIYESGTNRGTYGTYATNDVLKIAVENNVVKYYKNGTLLMTSAATPTLPLYVDVSTNSTGATASNVKVSNGNISTFTAVGTNLGVAPTYQWTLNGSNVGSNSTLYTNTGLVNGDVINCIVTPDLGGCSSNAYASNSITTIEPTNGTTTWIGTTTAWNTPANWTNGVPNKYNSAIITGGTSNPVISTNAIVNSLTIGAGKTLTINTTKALDVYGDITKTGNFTPNSSTITLYGCSGPNTITSTAGFSCYNLVINNTYGVTLGGTSNVTVTNALTLQDGIVSTGSNYLIASSTTAANLTYVNGFVNGNLRRHIASNTSTYDFPLGNGTNTTDRHVASILNNSLTGVTYINSSVADFVQSAPDSDPLLNTTQGGIPIIATVGEQSGETVLWTFSPNASPTGGSYGVRLSVENTTLSASEDNYFVPIKRTLTASYGDFSTFDISTAIPNIGAAGRIYNSGTGYGERLGYTTFSQHALGKGSGIPLPIELTFFDAKLIEDIVSLSWNTASETDNEYFTIEKSRNAEDYAEVVKVPTLAPGGNSTTLLCYSTNDEQPYEGLSYYRLKQTDFNGRFTYSDPVVVRYEKLSGFSLNVYPNPSYGDVVHFSIEGKKNQDVKLLLYDLYVKECFSGSLQTEADQLSVYTMDPSVLPGRGIYIVKALSGKYCKSKKLIIK
ncbi:MAG: T9SS type A sorting domain-containing protein [Bacteroidetes bacterium]|nr:T9SS type A sorting domain-containing protein [Bacteroidota bacterium]